MAVAAYLTWVHYHPAALVCTAGGGCETVQQSQAVQRMGCDIGQGFLFGQPLPLEQIIAMVRQRSVPAGGKPAARAS